MHLWNQLKLRGEELQDSGEVEYGTAALLPFRDGRGGTDGGLRDGLRDRRRTAPAARSLGGLRWRFLPGSAEEARGIGLGFGP